MAANTKIEWTDMTWNPIVGCQIVSPGCTNCYAMKMAARVEKMAAATGTPTLYEGTTMPSKAGAVWTGRVAMASEATLLKPLSWKKPRRIFVNSMGDLFADGVPDEWIDRVFAVMALCPQHTFQVLTKRPERMREYLKECEQRLALLTLNLACFTGTSLDKPRQHPAFRQEGDFGPTIMDAPHVIGFETWPLPNVWLGVSVEDQTRADERIPILLNTPAAVRWISAEPLLGPIDLNRLFQVSDDSLTQSWESALNGKRFSAYGGLDGNGGDVEGFSKLDWVVCGGESGTKARPMHPDWARSLRDQCADAGVPFFFKQWGEFKELDNLDGTTHTTVVDADSEEAEEWLTHCNNPTFLSGCGQRFHHVDDIPANLKVRLLDRVGKASAGHLLDGQVHQEFPKQIERVKP